MLGRFVSRVYYRQVLNHPEPLGDGDLLTLAHRLDLSIPAQIEVVSRIRNSHLIWLYVGLNPRSAPLPPLMPSMTPIATLTWH